LLEIFPFKSPPDELSSDGTPPCEQMPRPFDLARPLLTVPEPLLSFLGDSGRVRLDLLPPNFFII